MRNIFSLILISYSDIGGRNVTIIKKINPGVGGKIVLTDTTHQMRDIEDTERVCLMYNLREYNVQNKFDSIV